MTEETAALRCDLLDGYYGEMERNRRWVADITSAGERE